MGSEGMGMTKFWYDKNGDLLQATSDDVDTVDGATGSTETAPEDGSQRWNGGEWTLPDTTAWARLRTTRDGLLAETDWVTLKAVDTSPDGLGITLPLEWAEYRRSLRDLPDNTTDPANPVWPTKPS